jgi:CheY-like chemotaxis protein
MNRQGFETSFYAGQPVRILMVEDVPADAELWRRALVRHGYQVYAHRVATEQEFAQAVRQDSYDLLLCDYDLPGWSGRDALAQLKASSQDIPFILVTGTLDEEVAASLIDQGADDYVLKDRLERLPLAVRRTLREQRLYSELKRASVEREELIARLQETLAEVKRLNGLLPVCVTCKRILNTQGFWNRMEYYIERYSEAQVSPSLCPDCAAQMFPEHSN